MSCKNHVYRYLRGWRLTREESNPESHFDNLVGVRAAHRRRIVSGVPYLGNSGLPHQIDTVIMQSWSNKKLKTVRATLSHYFNDNTARVAGPANGAQQANQKCCLIL